MILQIAFDSLVSPRSFTVEFSILIATLTFSYLYISMKLRSLFGLLGWALMITSFVVSVLTPIQLLWFWIIAVLEAIILVFAQLEYTRAYARAKR